MGVEVDTIARPAFYDLTTADGVRYEQIARLHGYDVLATTVVQTCVRYGEADRCRFCAIEQSLRSGATTAVKTPAQLAEVAEAAVRLDGVRQMVMTTGTSNGRDRGARHLARCTAAVRAAVPGLPIQVQCEPPAPEDLAALTALQRRRRRRDRHPRRVPRRRRARPLDAGQGERAARAVLDARGARASASSGATPSRPTSSSASARTPTSSSPVPPS